MNKFVTTMLEEIGLDASDAQNYNWKSVDTHVELSNQIIYGEMVDDYAIVIHVPEGTTASFTIAFQKENGASKELKGSAAELTTDILNAALQTNCFVVRTE